MVEPVVLQQWWWHWSSSSSQQQLLVTVGVAILLLAVWWQQLSSPRRVWISVATVASIVFSATTTTPNGGGGLGSIIHGWCWWSWVWDVSDWDWNCEIMRRMVVVSLWQLWDEIQERVMATRKIFELLAFESGKALWVCSLCVLCNEWMPKLGCIMCWSLCFV